MQLFMLFIDSDTLMFRASLDHR